MNMSEFDERTCLVKPSHLGCRMHKLAYCHDKVVQEELNKLQWPSPPQHMQLLPYLRRYCCVFSSDWYACIRMLQFVSFGTCDYKNSYKYHVPLLTLRVNIAQRLSMLVRSSKNNDHADVMQWLSCHYALDTLVQQCERDSRTVPNTLSSQQLPCTSNAINHGVLPDVTRIVQQNVNLDVTQRYYGHCVAANLLKEHSNCNYTNAMVVQKFVVVLLRDKSSAKNLVANIKGMLRDNDFALWLFCRIMLANLCGSGFIFSKNAAGIVKSTPASVPGVALSRSAFFVYHHCHTVCAPALRYHLVQSLCIENGAFVRLVLACMRNWIAFVIFEQLPCLGNMLEQGNHEGNTESIALCKLLRRGTEHVAHVIGTLTDSRLYEEGPAALRLTETPRSLQQVPSYIPRLRLVHLSHVMNEIGRFARNSSKENSELQHRALSAHEDEIIHNTLKWQIIASDVNLQNLLDNFKDTCKAICATIMVEGINDETERHAVVRRSMLRVDGIFEVVKARRDSIRSKMHKAHANCDNLGLYNKHMPSEVDIIYTCWLVLIENAEFAIFRLPMSVTLMQMKSMTKLNGFGNSRLYTKQFVVPLCRCCGGVPNLMSSRHKNSHHRTSYRQRGSLQLHRGRFSHVQLAHSNKHAIVCNPEQFFVRQKSKNNKLRTDKDQSRHLCEERSLCQMHRALGVVPVGHVITLNNESAFTSCCECARCFELESWPCDVVGNILLCTDCTLRRMQASSCPSVTPCCQICNKRVNNVELHVNEKRTFSLGSLHVAANNICVQHITTGPHIMTTQHIIVCRSCMYEAAKHNMQQNEAVGSKEPQAPLLFSQTQRMLQNATFFQLESVTGRAMQRKLNTQVYTSGGR